MPIATQQTNISLRRHFFFLGPCRISTSSPDALGTRLCQTSIMDLCVKLLLRTVNCFSKNNIIDDWQVRSSHQRCFIKRGVIKNFAKFTGKHLCQSLFFKKKGFWHRCFPIKFAKFLGTPFLHNTSGRLLLQVSEYDFASGLLLIQGLIVSQRAEVN